MATEKDYDEAIAPQLLALAHRCEELGMSLVARVEWSPGESGTTTSLSPPEVGAAQKLAILACNVNGNIDELCLRAKSALDCSQSIFLNR